MRRPVSPSRLLSATAVGAAIAVAATVVGGAPASAHGWGSPGHGHDPDAGLTPRTSFTMAADGSSGATQGGEGIPNIDSVKKTIATYYGDPGTGIANRTDSPYIREMRSIVARQTAQLRQIHDRAVRKGEKPAIVLDADDTTLWTYDMEVADMHFVFDPTEQDVWVQDQRFPATPSMVGLVNTASAMGFTVFGLTGRNDDQKAATVANLTKVGYQGFSSDDFFTKWTGVGASQQPSYITCATASCTTVEYKAQTRKHIEQDLGYDIALNIGDQWSDLQGGYADRNLKLPNPTYYLPSADLPGVSEPSLAPRTHFTMAADGSSGATQGGEGIPNIDSVKKTIATYYGDPGTGIANRTDSPYIREMRSIVARQAPVIAAQCAVGRAKHSNPAIVLDADDTTLWTYDMEVADMHFVFDPTEQDVWVQDQRFPATPSMTSLVSIAQRSGCTVIGLTGRNDDQKTATIANLQKVGYPQFRAEQHGTQTYYTKWTGVGASQQPSYVQCATAKCTTIEYKSQTRAHIESTAGGRYDIVANVGDQYSDLKGGSADRAVKLPNPTYYLP
ncbi:HAD superfamily, subfamily IIIB (Acid phosphatase) [Curtobacterium sp. 9128]|uniref:HAD family acid phosphatase n=1 Tax=Curtobacterium sp. 9128 TaxID=1793722 RepID=UPI0007D7232A|nr:HAD family acid phosphatase [Curtobacterium sp. 9128]SBN64029.1 HAD superfamily, subfamily IIIB (Acid phosphatase) [Curtobacterium sp. 9128]